jgi:uncharacterized protein
MRVFLMGGTGLVGSRLVRRLLDRHDKVVLLSRRPDVAHGKWQQEVEIVDGDPMHAGGWTDQAATCDAVVNLVGEGIFRRRWNASFIQLLRDSRVASTSNIARVLATVPRSQAGQPKILVNASAIGYYGPHGDEELAENEPAGGDLMAGMCVDWEKATEHAEKAGVRTVRLRVGVVLDREGGALKQMLLPFKLFMGGPVGFGGRQFMSWIHHHDLTGLILMALDNANASGAMNATAPVPVTNKEFARALGHVLGRPSFMPTPKLMLRLALGKVAQVVTTGQRVVPKKALALGYQFKYPEIGPALADVLA